MFILYIQSILYIPKLLFDEIIKSIDEYENNKFLRTFKFEKNSNDGFQKNKKGS